MTDQQKESAKLHFKSNPKHEAYHVTEDGQCFVKEHDANNHQRDNKFKAPVALIKRSDVMSDKAPKTDDPKTLEQMNFKELQEAAAAAHPEDEWKALKSKAELVEYLTSKGLK